MKLVCIADTHNKHEELHLPDGDILIHAGDCTDAGTLAETKYFIDWFSKQSHKYKILVPGNHDFYFQSITTHEIQELMNKGILLLIDSGIEIEGFLFWGSPATPGSGRWAFNKNRGKELQKHWNKIPQNTNVLITHTPPYGILDSLEDGTHVGCRDLLVKVENLRPEIHLFGHIHEEYGSKQLKTTKFLNASNLDVEYRCIYPPISFSI